MNRADRQPLTPAARDRALGRLGRVTAGSGIGALLAVGGFSYVAAASYSGKQVTAPTAAAATSTAAASSATATPSSTATATAAPTVAPTTAPTAAPTAAPVVVSGGS
jgi:hypothetical protein